MNKLVLITLMSIMFQNSYAASGLTPKRTPLYSTKEKEMERKSEQQEKHIEYLYKKYNN